ncbi:hypothetical protein AB0H69_35635 [Streptomyces phaeochromogenes]|jgi:hypothetical protein
MPDTSVTEQRPAAPPQAPAQKGMDTLAFDTVPPARRLIELLKE